MAAHHKASLAPSYSTPWVTPLSSNQTSARRLASNSTGRVTKANKVVTANAIIVISIICGIAERVINAISNSHCWAIAEILTMGTNLDRNCSIG